MPVISIPRSLREKLGDEATEALTDVIKEIDIEARKDALALAEEKLERRLVEEMSKLRIEMHTELGNLKADMIKWMFIFWLGQIGVLSGIIFALLKL